MPLRHQLQTIDISHNNFTGGFPMSAPPGISAGFKCHYRTITTTDNPGLGGPIPEWLFQWCDRLLLVQLGGCGFTGLRVVPTSLGLLNATDLDLSMNALIGAVPTLANPVLVSLQLQGNALTAAAPGALSFLSALTSLAHVDLSDNPLNSVNTSLTEALMGLATAQYSVATTRGYGCGNLVTIRFSNCSLGGVVPQLLSAFCGAVWVDLSSNSLAGPLPLLGEYAMPVMQAEVEEAVVSQFPDMVVSCW
jgi:hypothetical protein